MYRLQVAFERLIDFEYHMGWPFLSQSRDTGLVLYVLSTHDFLLFVNLNSSIFCFIVAVVFFTFLSNAWNASFFSSK